MHKILILRAVMKDIFASLPKSTPVFGVAVILPKGQKAVVALIKPWKHLLHPAVPKRALHQLEFLWSSCSTS